MITRFGHILWLIALALVGITVFAAFNGHDYTGALLFGMWAFPAVLLAFLFGGVPWRR